MKYLRSLLAAAAICLSPAMANAGIKVVASIKPVHSLVAGVMQGAGTPHLIVEGAASPHSYALKPSQARALSDAQVVFWIGKGLEGFLVKPLANIAGKATSVALSKADGVNHLEYRELSDLDGKADSHDHSHGHKHGKGHDHGHDHADGDDPHLWLDPQNAAAMVTAIETVLVEADAANAATYKANAQALRQRLTELEKRIADELAPLKNRPFVVFHDAYQYFERRFGLEAAGAVTLSPETSPGAEHVSGIAHRIKHMNVVCVFSEPQFEPKLVSVVAEGSKARSAELDPLGAALSDGPDLYFQLMDDMARSMKHCLAGES